MEHSSKRLLAIGDIHGHLEKLSRLLEVVAPTDQDQMVFLGDYIDRGPQSREVIDCLLDLRKRFPRTVFLRGNHEQMLLDALVEEARWGRLPGKRFPDWRLRERSWRFAMEAHHSDWNVLMINGGQATLDSYGGNLADIPQNHIDFLAGLPSSHLEAGMGAQNRGCLFVHAGLRPRVLMTQQDLYDLLWIREEFLHANDPWPGWMVVHGHTPTLPVATGSPHRLCVDSGVYRSGPADGDGTQSWGKLTCCDVLTRRIWQVGD